MHVTRLFCPPLNRRTGGIEGPPVSIPFIAGQWSLQAVAEAQRRRRRYCLNPLHCGAVVASITDDDLPG